MGSVVHNCAWARLQKVAKLLQEQKVFVFEFGIKHIDVHEDLAAKSLKLKIRMNGITYLKSKNAKARQAGHDQCQINFDTIGSTIYEGGDVFDFELCQTRCFGSSQTLASCQLSVDTILECMDRKTWALKLLSVESPGKVLANFEVQLRCTMTLLKSVGGAKALKSMRVPGPPNIKSGSVFASNDEAEKTDEFIRKVGRAQEHLEVVFNDAGKREANRTDSDRFLAVARNNKVEL